MTSNYESSRSSVKISDGAKGSTVEVKVYAGDQISIERQADLEDATKKLSLGLMGTELQNAWICVMTEMKRLRETPSIETTTDAQEVATKLHRAALVRLEQASIPVAYDPQNQILEAWRVDLDYELAERTKAMRRANEKREAAKEGRT